MECRKVILTLLGYLQLQELSPAVKGELYFPSHSRLSCNFFPISPFNMMEDCHKPSRRLEEESLDLRLKLAL